jgi:hypothetical protein
MLWGSSSFLPDESKDETRKSRKASPWGVGLGSESGIFYGMLAQVVERD